MTYSKTSRTKKSFINSSIGSISKITSTLLNFIVRTIFIHYLSKEYLGINGLFSNILYVLNFAELGVGSAIIYNLYKPVAENDKERIKTLINLYKKIYCIIGLFVIIIGIIFIPFMDFIIKDPPNIKESLILIYILYLIETASTYFLGYKRSIFLVYQQNYINSLVELICSVARSVIQILFLILTKNYTLYLLIHVISTIFSNILISLLVNKKYPFLKEKDVIKAKKVEITEIKKNVQSLFLYKLGTTILSGTDNIILSAIVGIGVVGLYSNYSLIITAVSGILWTLLTGLTGSIGNLNTYKNKNNQQNIFQEVLFLSCMLYGFGTVCLSLLLNPFITIWIGEKYLLPQVTILLFTIICYLRGISFASNAYRDTLGLFKDGKIAPLICSIINITLSIILGKLFGTNGIFLATIISIITTTFWYMPKIIYKKIFEKKFIIYIKKIFIFTLPFIFSYILCINIFNLLPEDTITIFIIKTIITILITILITVILECAQKEYKEIKKKVYSIVKRG